MYASILQHNTMFAKQSQAEKLYIPAREFLDTSDTVWYTLDIAKVEKTGELSP